jgi:3'(2'), 5'-bisphosphate nucleotidase
VYSVSEEYGTSDDALAARLATWTGRLLVDVRESALLAGTTLGATGDAIAHRFLVGALATVRPGQAVLSEEAPDDRERLLQRAVWVIDPLDGTREYAEGREDFAVQLALVRDGEAVVGAVALPALGLTYSTSDTLELGEVPGRPLRIVVSRTRPPAFAERMADALGAEIVTMGSMGAKVIAVLRGDVDAYVHAGGYHEWDAAAPVAVARHAGLHATCLDGTSLRFNRPDTLLADLLVCRKELARRLLCAVGEARRGTD